MTQLIMPNAQSGMGKVNSAQWLSWKAASESALLKPSNVTLGRVDSA
jgi:hypothetical protein